MNNIITLRRLSEQIAKETGIEQAAAEEFVKALTSAISNGLEQGETVKLKGVGEFVPSKGRVSFTPAVELSEAINEPFAMFAPEELDPDLKLEDLKNPDIGDVAAAAAVAHQGAEEHKPEEKTEEPTPVAEPVAEAALAQPEAKQEAAPAPVTDPKPAEKPEPKPAEKPEPKPAEKHEAKQAHKTDTQGAEARSEPKAKQAPVPIVPFDDDEDGEDDAVAAYGASNRGGQGFPTFWVMWGVIFGLIVGLAIGFFVHDPIERLLEPSLDEDYMAEAMYDGDAEELPEMTPPEEEPIAEPDATAVETPAPVKEEPSAKPATATAPSKAAAEVYDTVREGNSLGSMAKKHYGSNIYWVYIYLENKDVIGNPNKVAVGTRLKIPPLSKYATKSTEAENKADAQKKVNEILRKYPN
ncbi:MAG: HU family DNA-binding protein [Bacteroidales bacterium]|nr:HU family DNA-binding protein [Bacteroidales bacterium]